MFQVTGLRRLAVRLRKSAFVVLAATFLTTPVLAQCCIVICYGTNPGVQITNWSGYWDFTMGYWTYSWTQTWTWDCTNTGCTSACAVCEQALLAKSTDGGTTWSLADSWTNLAPAAVCMNGNTDVWDSSVYLYPSTTYRFSWYAGCPSPGSPCNSLVWTPKVTKTFTTGPSM